MRADWVECKLGELFEFSQGIQVPKEEQYENNFEGGTRFLRIIDFTQENEPPRYVNYINGVHNVNEEDISMVRYGTVGFVCTGKRGAIANNLFRIIPYNGIFKKYAINFFKSDFFRKNLDSKGATMQALSFTTIKPMVFPLPPLPEQRAIVKKIEALFSSLDAGIADLKKAQDQLKTYRQAVLKKAFEGENYATIGSCCLKVEKIKRNTIDPNLNFKYVDIGSIDNLTNRIIGFKEYKWKDAPSRAQQVIKLNDILFSTVRTYLRNIAQVQTSTLDNEICSSGFTVLRVDNSKLNHRYLFHYTLFNGFLDELSKYQTGTSYPAVRDKDVFSQLIPLPTLEEQAQIVKEIESRLSVCDAVEQQIKDSLSQAEALRQSILKKAFEGRLLSEAEVTACQQEPDYEPASVLLEKIKAEKEANKPVKKTKKK